MSSGTCEFTCPQCKFENAIDHCELRPYEKFRMCPVCGYYWSLTIKHETINGKVVMCLDDEGDYVYEENEWKGYGVAYLANKYGNGKTSYFSEPITEEDIIEFNEIIKMDDINADKSYLRKWENGVPTTLAGNHDCEYGPDEIQC